MIYSCPDPAAWLQRIADRVIKENECWRWLGLLDRHGYGRFWFRTDQGRQETGAHRAAWLTYRGDIPIGLETDHLCRNRWCVNPWHLELVTHKINMERSVPWKPGQPVRHPMRRPSGLPKVYQCKTHGQENGYIRTSPHEGTRWVCRICVRNKLARRRAKKKLLAASN